MVSNRYLLFALAVVLCLILPPSLRAQTSGYYIELRYVQRLAWTGDEYALRYEVIIEKEENGKYRRVLQEFTTAFFIEVSLSAGKYRYQVIPYDYLDKSVPVSEWVNFEVQRSVTQGAQYDQFIPGDHEIIIVNPNDPEKRREIKLTSPQTPGTSEEAGETDMNTLSVLKSQFNLYTGLAWIPLLPVHGENDLYGDNLSFLGADVRLGIVSAKRNFLSLGAEGIFSYRAFTNVTGDESARNVSFILNALAQYRFTGGNMALNYRLGAGISLRPGADGESSAGQYSPLINLGVSFLWLPVKHWYLEAGMEYAQFFTHGYFGFIRPSIGAGYRF